MRISIAVLCLFVAGLGYSQIETYCDGDGCPVKFTIEGFDVRVAPTVYQAPDFTHTALGRDLDVLKAQLLWVTSSNSVPAAAIRRLIDSGVSFLLDAPSGGWSEWWPCGTEPYSAGCYSPASNRIGVSVVTAEWSGETWLVSDHTRQSFVLHELAHAFHWAVVAGRFDNACIERQYFDSLPLYEAVDEREQVTYQATRVPPHKRSPTGPLPARAHYATKNALEWFAEASEAMFAFNGQYPWDRSEFWRHDPGGFEVVWDAWHDPDGFCADQSPTGISRIVGPIIYMPGQN